MIWLIGAVALAGVQIDPPPVAGVESVVQVHAADGTPGVGHTVTVVHRIGLSGEDELAIGITDARGRVRWTPREGGVAEVRVGDQPLRLSVGWAATPLPATILLLLLAVAGVGAGGYGLTSSGRRAR